MTSIRRRLTVTVFAFAVLAIGAPTASASTLFVTSTSDSGPGSLRDTIAAALPADTIRVPAGTYLLNSELWIDKPLTIVGDSPRTTMLDGQEKTRIVYVEVPTFSGVTISGLTLQNGSASEGGAVMAAQGGLRLTNDAFRYDTAIGGGGGAIYVDRGAVVMERDLVTASVAAGSGGGVELASPVSGTSRIADSTIYGNVAHVEGGGIDLASTSAQGLVLSGDTLDGNIVEGPGTTYGGNLATATLTHVSFDHTAFLAGYANDGANCMIDGTSDDAGLNVEDGLASCALQSSSSFSVFHAKLSELGDHGGPTDTLLPAADSPLLDAGSACDGVDQRGVPRMLGYACDIGAVERTADPTVAKPALTKLTSTGATLSASVDTEFIGGSASFHYGAAVADGASTPDQLLPAGVGVEVPVTATLTGLTAGTTYRVRVVMHTALGDVTSPELVFTAPVATVVPRVGLAPLPVLAPTIAKARLTNDVFRVSPLATAVAATDDAPFGTRFRLSLARKAKVRIRITHRVHGHTVVVGTLRRAHLGTGAVSVAFSGRIGSRALKPGRYTATITAMNAAGTAKAAKLRFTIVE
jgi:hypothetical protein